MEIDELKMIKQKQQGDLIREQQVRLIELEKEVRRNKIWANYYRAQIQNYKDGKALDQIDHIKKNHERQINSMRQHYTDQVDGLIEKINKLKLGNEELGRSKAMLRERIALLEDENKALNCRIINRTKEMEDQKIKTAVCFLSTVIFAAIAAYVVIAH